MPVFVCECPPQCQWTELACSRRVERLQVEQQPQQPLPAQTTAADEAASMKRLHLFIHIFEAVAENEPFDMTAAEAVRCRNLTAAGVRN